MVAPAALCEGANMGTSGGCAWNIWGVAYIALLVIAAIVDARTRSFPNRLAGVLLLVCAVYGSCGRGLAATAHDALGALAVCLILVAFELFWRRAVGTAGLGMGDVKFLFVTSWCGCGIAISSFAAGLLSLGVCAFVFRRPSLPLLPFVVPFQVLLTLAA